MSGIVFMDLLSSSITVFPDHILGFVNSFGDLDGTGTALGAFKMVSAGPCTRRGVQNG